MTDKELKEKILAEIERLKDECYYSTIVPKTYMTMAYDNILTFINSLSEESEIEVSYNEKINEAHRLGREEGMFLAKTMFKEPVSEDLEEAAKHYLYSNILYDDVYVGNPTDKDCIEMFKAGAQWQKQQMMKDAVEVQVNPLLGETFVGCMVNGYKVGDKVKLIIIKED